MKFRWRSWLYAGGLSNKATRRICQSRVQWSLLSWHGYDRDQGFTVDLTKKTIELWRENND